MRRVTGGSGMRVRRGGFTLAELLVVILIISLLASLTAGATIRFIGAQQTSNTRTALTKLRLQLEKHWSAVRDKALREDPSAVVKAMAGGDNDRAKVIWAKLRLKQAFPTSIKEATNASLFPLGGGIYPLPSYRAYLTNATGVTPEQESSVCLLMALQQGPSGGGVKMEDLGVSGMIVDNGSGAKYLADAWGSPLTFCRWPVGSPLLNPGGPQTGIKNDLGDPLGTLALPAWLGSPLAGQFKLYCHLLPTSAGMSYRLAPLIVSNGPDKTLGLDPATLAVTSAAANDNLYSIDQ